MSSSSSNATRAAILEAAWRHLENEGTAGLRMGTVAREAGFSRQAVYLHFGNRGGLLLALVQYVDTKLRLGDLLGEVGEAHTPSERVERQLAVTAHYAPRIHSVAQIFERDRYTDTDIRQAWEDRMEGRRRGLRSPLEQLGDEGRLRPEWPVERAVDALWAMGLPAVHQALVVERTWSPEDHARLLIETFHGMLEA